MTNEPNGNAPLTIAELRDQLNSQTGFRRDLLRCMVDGESRSGAEVKERIETLYGEVNHGRLYPNLDQLVDAGLLEKGQRDRRTNSYEITGKARQFITFVNNVSDGFFAPASDEATDADSGETYEELGR